MFSKALNTSYVKNSDVINSEHIMYENSYLSGSFALKRLIFFAYNRSIHDSEDKTYNAWFKKMGYVTYSDRADEQAYLDSIR